MTGAEPDVGLLDEAVRAVDAPDVVFGISRDGHRTVRSGGTRPATSPVPRDRQRYEIGSASKTLTGLLLADLDHTGVLSAADPVASLLDPNRPPGRHPATLWHLITHTSGLPPLPADLYPRALPRWYTNPYAGYPSERVVRAFFRARPARRPGTRWRYSNFGVAVLGHALVAATATPWERLLTARVLRPLGLDDTVLSPTGPGTDATGHRADGVTPVPPLRIGGFQAAGAVHSTPYDLLTYLEALLRPEGGPLATALLEMRRPLLRRGRGHEHTHTLAWFCHPVEDGTMYFHIGATSGQVAFLGFRPDRGTALVALSTRRYSRTDALVPTAYALLAGCSRRNPPC
ncbi:serine hydrolase domain-containing protein [Streptomyces sp. NPDC015131]|uniref:serine hydrolase domain-containing protein n=1 Tax=Streptomyces sp. NPDC015131 TaxID=3364941 RepID=UPI0036FCCB06